ncbi:hypothetical protein WJX72_011177 [[Myrmecia] bisecta]|uniref:Vacuolar protein sorting-associated protein 33A n=1 Tax=[Myrmecia] bisecta TaxID=41462 RepID=A0AAW1R957_9CHLO
MATPLPNFDEGSVPLAQIRDEARKLLIDALDSRRGKKVLVLDPKISGFLGMLAEVPLLKEHGVEQLLHLGSEPFGDLGCRSVIYLVRSRIENAQLIAQQVKASNRQGAQLEYSVFFLPRRTIVCEKVFEEEGVTGDVIIGEYPLDFIPFDYDVLSLEQDTACKELAHLGTIPAVKGKGTAAAAVLDMLSRMRKEPGADAGPGSGAIDMLVLLDREVDCVTPLCTQLTYEGLADEVLRIRNGCVQLDQGGSKTRIVLNSADRVFRDLRDLSFAAVGPQLGARAKMLQSDYKDTKAAERSLSELKEFAAQLKTLPHITRHINLAEQISRQIGAQNFRDRVTVEQAVLDGHGTDASCEAIEEMMYGEEELMGVLRLMCLISLTQGGVPKKQFDALRKEVLHTYGHEHILTLTSLQDAGLLRRQEGGKSSFGALKRALKLLVDDIDDKNPTDVAYTFSGYAPISIRLVEAAVKAGGWGALEEVFKLLPGPHFDVVQTTDENGMPVERSTRNKPVPGLDSKKRLVVLVMFIGGVTFAEIAALRFLSTQPNVNCDFVVATTKLINGSTLLESFVDETVQQAMKQAKLE